MVLIANRLPLNRVIILNFFPASAVGALRGRWQSRKSAFRNAQIII